MKRLFIFIACLLLAAMITGGWWLGNDMEEYFHTPIQSSQAPFTYTIIPGTSFQAVLKELHERKILGKPYYLYYLAKKQGVTNKIKAGEYHIHAQITPKELLNLLVSGRVIQYSLTLIEGWSFKQVMQAVKNNGALTQTLADAEAQTILSALDLVAPSPEGLFLAETYHFPADTTDTEFLRRANRALTEVLNQEWKNRSQGLPYLNSYDALIMASIIEKETARADERARIAGVFVRRLNINMKLQSDPTVIYAMGERYRGNIRKKHLSIDSPYNTYVYKGLPPTPIALVGREAIHVALQPENGKELYFVARGDGSHQFSETLPQHNRAVAKYQLKKNKHVQQSHK